MKHYEKLLELGCFSKNDLEQITGSEAAAKWLCREYQKKGYIERVKRDLYVAISLETQQPIANRYVIASHISNDAAVSYHSAFEFYGYSNQVFYETQVTSVLLRIPRLRPPSLPSNILMPTAVSLWAFLHPVRDPAAAARHPCLNAGADGD